MLFDITEQHIKLIACAGHGPHIAVLRGRAALTSRAVAVDGGGGGAFLFPHLTLEKFYVLRDKL